MLQKIRKTLLRMSSREESFLRRMVLLQSSLTMPLIQDGNGRNEIKLQQIILIPISLERPLVSLYRYTGYHFIV